MHMHTYTYETIPAYKLQDTISLFCTLVSCLLACLHFTSQCFLGFYSFYVIWSVASIDCAVFHCTYEPSFTSPDPRDAYSGYSQSLFQQTMLCINHSTQGQLSL